MSTLAAGTGYISYGLNVFSSRLITAKALWFNSNGVAIVARITVPVMSGFGSSNNICISVSGLTLKFLSLSLICCADNFPIARALGRIQDRTISLAYIRQSKA